MTRAEAAGRLDVITSQLRGLYNDHTETLRAKRTGWSHHWLSAADVSTSTDRRNWADAQVVDLTGEVLDLEGQIRVLEEERDHLRFKITHRLCDDDLAEGALHAVH